MSPARDEPQSEDTSFFANILTPGSSLHPTFLLVVDCAFLILLLVFVVLALLTSGNPHIFALMVIELCLWASVKWFVNELKQIPVETDRNDGTDTSENEARKTR
ncbi:hypothetical protein GALMADRAFT_109699 [Galerina marginata CBS 339.88]|uniref:V-type ATPase assembly factor PKR1 n=1 Tax=Galerina marginata (strain CBS 339.88) TaxID=685588 RepID=A0A067TLX0_GALM3|nr:hypothetical protein GALMADRAFT_109699 [Galerina marginata CBS 339.88]